MGYTHYFYRKRHLDENKFEQWTKLLNKMVNTPEAHKVLAEEYDLPDNPPVITKDLVKFNGKDDDGHETFYCPVEERSRSVADSNNRIFEFCKTAHKPYDKYVVAAIILGKVVFGVDWSFSSDGELDELEDGRALAEQILGSKITLKEIGKGRDSIGVKVEEQNTEKNCHKYQKV